MTDDERPPESIEELVVMMDAFSMFGYRRYCIVSIDEHNRPGGVVGMFPDSLTALAYIENVMVPEDDGCSHHVVPYFGEANPDGQSEYL